MKLAFISLLGTLLVLFPIGIYLSFRFDGIIKKRHPGIHESLGEFHPVTNNTPAHTLLSYKFIFSNQWKTLSDDELSKIAKTLKIFIPMYILIFISVTIAGAIVFSS